MMNTKQATLIGILISIGLGIILGVVVWSNSIKNDFVTLKKSVDLTWANTEKSIKHLSTFYPQLVQQVPRENREQYIQTFQAHYTQLTASTTHFSEKLSHIDPFIQFIESLIPLHQNPTYAASEFNALRRDIKEEQIALAKHTEFYNQQLQIFPKNLVGTYFGFTPIAIKDTHHDNP